MDAPTLDITLDPAGIARLEAIAKDAPELIARALSHALNAGKLAIRNAAVGKASALLGIDAATIRERVWGHSAKPDDLYSRVRHGKIGWPVARFSHAQEKFGTRVNFPGRGEILFPHAFIARMPGGHEGVFIRKPGFKRLPIQEVRTDDVTLAVMRAAAEPEIVALGAAKANATLEKDIGKILSGGKL